MLTSIPAMAQPAFYVQWNANQEFDLAGYRVFWGKASGQYPDVRDVGKTHSTTLSSLMPGTRYFLALQAYNNAGLASQLSQEVSFVTPPPEPEIEVRTIDGDLLADGGGVVSFGAASLGSYDSKRTWTIHNRGTGNLTGLAVALSGQDTADFIVEKPIDETLAPGASANLTVSFNPSSTGARSALLSISSSDFDESSFEIALAGTGSTPLAIYSTWIATGGLSGGGASPSSMPFNDGVSNLVKYAFNLNPGASDVRTLIKGTGTAGRPVFDFENDGNQSWFRVEFIRRIGSGLHYAPKVSTDLITYTGMVGTTALSRINDEWERVIVRQEITSAPPKAMFGRVEVSFFSGVAGPSPAALFQAWTAAHGLSGNDAVGGATPHHDGVPNLLKYAFNMDGAGPDRRVAAGSVVGLPVYKVEGNSSSRTFVVEYLRRRSSGLVYQPKVSSDLTNFSPMTGNTSVTAVADGWDRVTVRMPVPTGGSLFGRVDVTIP